MNFISDAVSDVASGKNPAEEALRRKKAEALEQVRVCRTAKDAVTEAIEEALKALNSCSMCLGIPACFNFMKEQTIGPKLEEIRAKYEEFKPTVDDIQKVYEWPVLRQILRHNHEAQELVDTIFDAKKACEKAIDPDIDKEELQGALEVALEVLGERSNEHFDKVEGLLE